LCNTLVKAGRKEIRDRENRRWHGSCASAALSLWGTLTVPGIVDGTPMDGEEFRARQEAAGKTNPEIASLLQVSLSTVEKWRAGLNPVPGTVAILLRIIAPKA